LSLLVVTSVDSAATYLRQEALRSRDGTFSGLNPVLASSDQDKAIANPKLTAAQRKAIARARDINNSDVDLCEYRGKTMIYLDEPLDVRRLRFRLVASVGEARQDQAGTAAPGMNVGPRVFPPGATASM
jgi:hypothetical protein